MPLKPCPALFSICLPSKFYQGLPRLSSQLQYREESNVLIETMEIETKPMEEYPPVAPSNPVHEMMEINRLKESKAKAMQSLTEIYEHLKTNIEANI